MRRRWPALLLLFALVPFGTPQASNGRCADRCRTLGECSPQSGGSCVALVDEDCQASEACTRHGRCTVREGICVATRDDDCAASTMCLERGECSVVDGHCEVVSDLECQASQGCADEGRCTVQDAVCVVGSAADCAGSALCAASGACGFRSGTCVPTLDAHCEQSAACRDDGLCTLLDGTCTEAAPTDDTGSEEVDPDRPIQVAGPLRPNGVRKVLREVRAEALRCGPLTAEVELTATIEPSGKVVDIAVLGVPRKQEKCIAKALKQRRLPEKKRPSTLTWRLHRPD